MKERVQVYYDSDVDVKVHELIQAFEEQGGGKRGYANAKLKECLKVYQVLAERCGKIEPMDVLLFYIDSLDKPSGRVPRDTNTRPIGGIHAEKEEPKETKRVSDKVDDDVASLVGDGGFDFE